jgi:hypothetical protein
VRKVRFLLHARLAGAASIRHFLRPPSSEERTFRQASGAARREIAVRAGWKSLLGPEICEGFLKWLHFVDTYRTLCIDTPAEIRATFEIVRNLSDEFA